MGGPRLDGESALDAIQRHLQEQAGVKMRMGIFKPDFQSVQGRVMYTVETDNHPMGQNGFELAVFSHLRSLATMQNNGITVCIALDILDNRPELTGASTCARNTLSHEKVAAPLLGLYVGNTYVEYEKVAAPLPAISRSVIPTLLHKKVDAATRIQSVVCMMLGQFQFGNMLRFWFRLGDGLSIPETARGRLSSGNAAQYSCPRCH